MSTVLVSLDLKRLNQSINILQLEQCLSALHIWFSLNGLALNPSKCEVILMGTRQRSASLPSLSNISVAGSTVPFSPQVKLLGITLDISLSLNKHVASVSKSCFSACARYDTPSLTTRKKPLPARSSSHDLTTLTPYWLARHPKTSTGCNTSRTHWRGLS